MIIQKTAQCRVIHASTPALFFDIEVIRTFLYFPGHCNDFPPSVTTIIYNCTFDVEPYGSEGFSHDMTFLFYH